MTFAEVVPLNIESSLCSYWFVVPLLILFSFLRWKNKNYACPTDPKEEKTCNRLNCFNKYLYIFTIIIFTIGGFSTFILPKLYQNNLF